MRVLSVVVAMLVVLALSWGCATPTPPVPAGGGQPTSPSSGVVTLDIFGFTMAENWDADPEVDGIVVEIWPKDAEDHTVEAAGTVSAKLWLQKSILEPEKGELIQTWTNIPVSEEDYGFIGGAILRLEYHAFAPTGDQWGILEVTFTNPDGIFTAREKDIHLGEGEPVPPEPESVAFELKKWQVIDDSGVAALKISFSATKDLKFLLTDPAGVEVGFEYAELGVTGARLWMAGYGETPPAGVYTLLVKRYEGIVNSIAFDFEGASLEVIDVETSWEYFESLEYYILDELTIVVANHGDLPAYIDKVKLKLDGEAETLYIFNGAVLSGKELMLTPSVYISDIPPGKYELTLKIKDSAGETLASYSGTVKPRR